MKTPPRDTIASDQKPLITELLIEPQPLQALAALFDDGLGSPQVGDDLPALWHWASLARWHNFSVSGPDGHAKTGGTLPNFGKPRRMFVGGEVSFHEPLVVGDRVNREERVTEAVTKTGTMGEFILVTLESTVRDSAGRVAIRERRDLVYRDAVSVAKAHAAPGPPATLVPRMLSREGERWWFNTDPTALLRFSSATSNSHRIHIDQPYATHTEGYPGLVVHGPLMTMTLAEVVRHEWPGRAVAVLRHRNLRPLFCGEAADIQVGNQGTNSADLRLVRNDNAHVIVSVDFAAHESSRGNP